jgi:hypothetical protein
MTLIHALGLPILLSSVFVFLASAVLHMALPWHHQDYKKVPREEELMDALRPLAIPPGDYMVPGCAQPKEMRTPEYQARIARGPVMIATVLPNGMWTVGRSLALWYLYVLVISFFAGYLSFHALPAGAVARHVVRFAGLAAFLGYAPALWQMSIWYRRSWVTTLKVTIDGAVFAAVTAATFAWLWPK